MKFFSKLRKDTNGDDSTSGGTSISINDSLDYFSQHGQLGKMIVANQRQVVNSMGDRIQSLSSLDIDLEMNKEMIKETALLKYGTSEQDLSLMDTAWFPRFKNKLRNKKGKTRNDVDEGDNESIISYGSDYSQDGFAGPFSWETKSLQEMVLPPTPVGERKLTALHLNNMNDNNNNALPGNKKKNNKKKSIPMTNGIESHNSKSSHRTYETIEELRARLTKNYREAKKQREKYLNIGANKTSKSPDTSINGYRSKTQQQKIFKNYKLKQEDNIPKERTNTTVSFAVDDDAALTSSSASRSISFAEELSNALQRQGQIVSSATVTNTPIDDASVSITSNKSLQNTTTSEIFYNPSREAVENPIVEAHEVEHKIRENDESVPPNKEGNICRKNSIKNLLKRSDSKNEKNEKRKNSLKPLGKSEIITQEDVENVLENQHSKRDSVYKSTTDDGGLNNVMDMLANW